MLHSLHALLTKYDTAALLFLLLLLLLLLLHAQLFTVSVPADMEAQARGLVTEMAPGARLTYSVGGTLKYELPADQVGTHGRVAASSYCV